MSYVQVTLLLPSAQLSGDSSADGRRVMTQVTDYNQRMSGEWRPVQNTLMHYLFATCVAHYQSHPGSITAANALCV